MFFQSLILRPLPPHTDSKRLKLEDMDEAKKALKQKKQNQTTALRRINKLFSIWDKANVMHKLDEYEQTIVTTKGIKKWYVLRNYDDYDKFPDTLKKYFTRTTVDDTEYSDVKEQIDSTFPQNKFPDKFDGTYDIGYDENGKIVVYTK